MRERIPPKAKPVPRFPRPSHRLIVAAAAALIAAPQASRAQDTGAKVRLELSDSALAKALFDSSAKRSQAATPTRAGQASADRDQAAGGFRGDFVRTQVLLGVGIYAPAFATTVARDGVAWAASYMLVAGGSFVAAAEVSRNVAITDPMQLLATWSPVQGAVAGSILGEMLDADSKGRAGAILFGSLGGTTMALWRGKGMNEGEAAATLFGTNTLGLLAFGGSMAAGLEDDVQTGETNKTRLGLTLAGMVAGAPLGHAYAALAPYHVSRGDLTAMTAAAGVGVLAGLATLADAGSPSDAQYATAATLGGVAGLVAGDRLLAKRYDHTPAEGRFVVAGGVAGALMGAGVALAVRGDDTEWNTLSATLTAAGAAGGIALTQRYAKPKADGGLLGRLTIHPTAVVAAAAGMRGTYTLGSIRF